MADEKIQVPGTVTPDGQIMLPRRFRSDVARLFSGKDIIVTVERKRKKRSKNQNAYYWAVVVSMICEGINEAGDNITTEEAHEFLKFRFLRYQKINEKTGNVLWEYGKSSAALNTVEFMIFIDHCIQFAAEYLHVTIPPPYTMTDQYMFPEFAQHGEARESYVDRIGNYLEMIFDVDTLKRYFKQVPDWAVDQQIKALFNARHAAINRADLF